MRSSIKGCRCRIPRLIPFGTFRKNLATMLREVKGDWKHVDNARRDHYVNSKVLI